MFMNLRRVRKYQFLQLLCMCCVLSTLMLYWEPVDHHIVSHMKSYSYRYLFNSFGFVNKSFGVSREQATGFGSFPYLLDHRDLCKGQEVLLLLFVKTSPENFQRRRAIRSTWGNETYVRTELGVNVKVVYVTGVHQDRRKRDVVQKQLEDEDRLHRDVVQQDFLDTFHNLTLKLLLQFRWAHNNCPRARFLMSADDDIFVHMPNLVSWLQEHSARGSTDLWVGHVHRGSPPVRRKGSKYYMPYKMYPWSSYPDYTAGAGYVVSRDVAEKIYRATFFLNASMHIDDVFMGICGVTVGVSPQEHVYFSGEGKAPYHPCIYAQMITSHGHEGDLASLWKVATAPEVHGVYTGFAGKLYCAAVKIRLLCLPHFTNTYSCRAAFL